MKVLNVQQGTDQWHKERANRYGASEAPAMMGESKYRTRSDLIQEKATGATPAISPRQKILFERGHEAEESARPVIEEEYGIELFPATGVHDELDHLLASLDGITMDDATIWEHKLWNENLAKQVRAGELEAHYYWQLEHQLFVSGAERAIFTCSDGVPEKCVSMEYTSVPERRQQLLAGWEQFQKDVEAYKPREDAPEAVGSAPGSIPALRVEVRGEVVSSNLIEFRNNALAVFGAINKDLQTDQDFADAEQTVKWCKDVETRLDMAKDSALAQTQDLDELFRTIDSVKETCRQTRLELDRLVKARKQARREEILEQAKRTYEAHVAGLEQNLSETETPITLRVAPPDFANAMKGKKTIKSLCDAADDALAQAKIAANEKAEFLRANLKRMAELAKDHRTLFPDWRELIEKAPDDLGAAVKLRISEHEQAEKAREEAERAERERREQEAGEKSEAAAQEQTREAAETLLDGVGEKIEEEPRSEERPAKAAPGGETTLFGDLNAWRQEFEIGADAYKTLLDLLNKHHAIEEAA